MKPACFSLFFFMFKPQLIIADVDTSITAIRAPLEVRVVGRILQLSRSETKVNSTSLFLRFAILGY